MTKVGTAEFDVELSRAKLQAEIAAAGRDIEVGLGASGAKVESEMSRHIKTAVKGFVAFKGVEFGKEAIAGAESLAQQQQRANVEFGKGVEIVDQYAKHAATGAGISEVSALKAASAFGTMFHSIGVGQTQSAQMSTTLVQLASDFSALHGTSQEEAVAAIQHGLGGMGRGLRQYGIFLTDANLKQEAVRLGLAKHGAALTQAQKTQAAYAIIVKGGANANGAFADQAGTALGKQKILNAEWSNTKDKIGNDLVPAMGRLLGIGTKVLDLFDGMTSGEQQLVLGTAALVGGVSLLSGPLETIFKIGKGVGGFIGGLGAEAGQAGAAVTPLADAEMVLARETALTNIAIEAQTAALAEGAGVVDASLAGIAARTEAEQAMVVADEEATASSAGLMAAMGPLGIAIGVLGAAYAAFKLGGSGKLKIDNPAGLLGDTKEELLKVAVLTEKLGGGESGFEAIGRKSLPALKLLRDTVKGAGGDTSQMDEAIKAVIATNDRAAAAQAKYGDKIADAGHKQETLTADVIAYERAVTNSALAEVQRTKDLESAKVAEQGTSLALTQAVKDEALARRAAAGDSDQYRAALETIARDKDAEAKASHDLADAEKSLVDARESARRSLRDERLDNERTQLSAERAKLALLDAKDNLTKVQDDPRATARQKEQALLDERDAEISLQDAQHKRGDSAADLAKAEAAGIEGSAQVVAAKQKVIDAEKAVQAATKQTALDTKAAAKIITDAKVALVAAEGKTRDAVLAEADAVGKITGLAYGAAAGNDAFNASLIRSLQLLAPDSPFSQELAAYASELGILNGNTNTTVTPVPSQQHGHTVAPGDVVPGQPLTSHGKPLLDKPRGRSVVIGQINMRNGPTPAEIANEMAFG